MTIRSTNPWETEDISSLVSIGTHKLHVTTSGPPRKPGSPVLIFLTGGGVPAYPHLRLLEQLSSFVRVYFYDRTGYDRSERGPNKILLAENAAEELMILMKDGINVQPPYILLSHSYGCIIARTFLALYPDPACIAGMVLAEAATEMMYQVYSNPVGVEFEPLLAGLDLDIVLDSKHNSGLTDDEWDQAMQSIERSQSAAADEDNRTSGLVLARFQQFKHQALSHHRPLSVIRCQFSHDFHLLYDAGVKAGNGTPEQREKAKAALETMDLFDDETRASQLRLSSCNRYVTIEDCGHDVPFRRPEVLAQEVRWVLEQWKENQIKKQFSKDT